MRALARAYGRRRICVVTGHNAAMQLLCVAATTGALRMFEAAAPAPYSGVLRVWAQRRCSGAALTALAVGGSRDGGT